jgi:hypothetical protein
VQSIFATLAKPANQTVITIVFVDLGKVVAVRTILNATVTAETVNVPVG